MAIVARGDLSQAEALEPWLLQLWQDYGDRVLGLDSDAAQRWRRLRVHHPEQALDKPVAASALRHDLTVVTRHMAAFLPTGHHQTPSGC